MVSEYSVPRGVLSLPQLTRILSTMLGSKLWSEHRVQHNCRDFSSRTSNARLPPNTRSALEVPAFQDTVPYGKVPIHRIAVTSTGVTVPKGREAYSTHGNQNRPPSPSIGCI